MDQRQHHRFEPLREMQVAWRSDSEYSISVMSDLSPDGAFIRTAKPTAPETILHLLLEAPGGEIRAQAVVRRSIPGEGMGVEFQSMSKDDRDRFESLLGLVTRLSQAPTPRTAGKLREEPAAVPSPIPTRHAKAAEKSSAPPAASPGPSSRSRRSAERRAHMRYKVTGMVEATKVGSGQSIKASLGDLGRMGCYVKTDSPCSVGTFVEIAITRGAQSFRAQAKVVSSMPGEGMGLSFTAVKADQDAILDQWLVSSMEASLVASNRRRSQRILMNISIQVDGTNSLGASFTEETETISVSANGALILLSMAVVKGQSLTLWNRHTNTALECSVVYVGQVQDQRRQVGISFTRPNRMFWGVVFPAWDWSSDDLDAKGT